MVSPTRYRTFVFADAAPNTLVATVQAFDPDGDQVTYEISGGNGEGNFLIDPQKGNHGFQSQTLLCLQSKIM